jgi:hypothetical protein
MAGFGFFLVVLSAIFNGSFVAFAKLKSVADANVHPILFNFYLVLGVFVSSWICACFLPLVGATVVIPPLGLLSGLLLVISTACSFVAVSFVGLSTGQGVWGGTAILISFLWGSVGPHDPGPGADVKSWGVSAASLVLLLLGVGLIVKCEDIAALIKGATRGRSLSQEERDPAIVALDMRRSDHPTDRTSDMSVKPEGGSKIKKSDKALGARRESNRSPRCTQGRAHPALPCRGRALIRTACHIAPHPTQPTLSPMKPRSLMERTPPQTTAAAARRGLTPRPAARLQASASRCASGWRAARCSCRSRSRGRASRAASRSPSCLPSASAR